MASESNAFVIVIVTILKYGRCGSDLYSFLNLSKSGVQYTAKKERKIRGTNVESWVQILREIQLCYAP